MKTEMEKRDEPQGEALGILKGLALERNFPKMPRFDLKGAQGRTLILSIFLFTFSFLILPSIASAGVIRKPPNNLGLTGYWALDDGAVGTSGGVAGDSSGNRRNGLLTVTGLSGPPIFVIGKRGNAVSFDGINDVVTTAVQATQLFSHSTSTISVWVKPTGTSPTASEAYIAARIVGTNAGVFSLGIGRGVVGGVDKIWAFTYASGNTKVGVDYTNDVWTHIVLVHASSTLYIYKNGVLGGSVASGDDVFSSQLWFGAGGGGSNFAGTIDEVRTYNRALEPSDIAYLYQSGSTKIGLTNKSPGTLANGLTGHWTFDGKDMVSNVADVSGNGNTGYLVNYPATTTAPGAVGQALGFRSASSQYVNIPNTAGNLSPGTGDFATSFWYKGSPGGSFFAGDEDSIDGEWDIGFVGGVGKFYFVSDFFEGYAYGNFALPSDTNWHYVVFMLDRSTTPDTFSAYVDGASVAVTIQYNDINDQNIGSNSITLGGLGYFAGAPYRNTPMDEVRIYNRLLTASEIKQLANIGAVKVAKTSTPTGSLQTGLVGHWTFDGPDVSGTTVTDKSGNGRNGTLTNGPVPTIGKIGQALTFDGTNDYVDIGDNAAWEPSGSASFSVSFWYKGLKGATESFLAHSPGISSYWYINQNEALFCGGSTCNASVSKSYTLPTGNEWHHLVVVLNRRGASSDSLTAYIDGVAYGTAATGTLNDNATTCGTNTLIGGTWWSFPTGYRQGPMDDVRIYNRVLSASEVKQLYNLGR